MLSVVTLDDLNGNPVTLHLDAPNGKRWLTSALGLRGVQSLRTSKRVRPQAHGGINETRFEDGRSITLVGEIMSTVGIEDAFNEFGLVAAPMLQTLDNGPALLKWQEGSGALNPVPDPSFEYDTIGSAPGGGWTTLGVAPSTFAVQNGWASSGTRSLRLTATLGTSTSSQARSGDIPVVGGQSYPFRFVVNVLALPAAASALMQVDWFDITDAFISQVFAVSTNSLGVQTLTSASLAAPSNAAFARVRLILQTGANAGMVDSYLDAVMMGSGTYFDGDSSGAEWTGTPGNSTSRMGHALQRLVKLDGDLDPPIQEGQALLAYQAQLFSEDPRAYSQVLQTVPSTGLSTVGGGHTFPAPYPRTYFGSGGGLVSFTNYGNRPTPPLFRIYGACQNPRIVLIGTTLALSFMGTLAAGDFLEIDAAKRTVRLNGSTNRLNFYDGANSTWFDLPVGTANLQLLAVSSDGNARLDVVGRSAFA